MNARLSPLKPTETPIVWTPKRIARFENKYEPEPNSGCFLWLGSLSSPTGSRGGRYARVKLCGKVHNASRVSHNLYKGPVPADMMIMHSCDNPMCVNPDHLSIGTHSDNMKDMYAKGRQNRGSSK